MVHTGGVIRKEFRVEGMHCAACSARVERAVRQLPGVVSAKVNLVAERLFVEYGQGVTTPAEVAAAVKRLGFRATALEDGAAEEVRAREPRFGAGRRTAASLLLLLPLLYFSLGGRAGAPLPSRSAILWFQAAAGTAVLVLNARLILSGWRSLFSLHPDMNSLVALGACSAWVYGLCGWAAHGDGMAFETAATIVAFISLGRYLEARAFKKSRDAVEGLRDLLPGSATLVEGGAERRVAVDSLAPGDLVLVRTGESIPADGVIESGCAAVDQGALTGESMPVDLREGDEVMSGSIVSSGLLRVRVARSGGESSLARIVRLVQKAGAEGTPAVRLADRVSFYFVPVVIALALLTLGAWLWSGEERDFAFDRMLAVLVVSCPCALGLAAPMAVTLGAGRGARLGILAKTAAAFEKADEIDAIVFDKTGTLTEGRPVVDRIVSAPDETSERVMAVAAALELNSEHPLARAVVRAAGERNISVRAAKEPRIVPGQGVFGDVDGELCMAGNARLFEEQGVPFPKEESAVSTPIHLARSGKWIGTICLGDRVRDDSRNAVAALRRMNVLVVLLTGDRETVARDVARSLGIERVVAQVLPDGKSECVRELRRQGRCVAMVGDGVNDAPALRCADLGVAVGSGTDIAMQAADMVLLNNRPSDAAVALRLGRATMRIIRQNIFWAFLYNVIGIPLAAGAFFPVAGLFLPPSFAALAMGCSSLMVVGNSLRLLRFPKCTPVSHA
ncbi:MAG: cadmium-translocating P-type ATPase [Akkermansiaceae bacterium]|nr:cadmium-translocating P-type ATPase [Akkermansiaceae bacterium]